MRKTLSPFPREERNKKKEKGGKKSCLFSITQLSLCQCLRDEEKGVRMMKNSSGEEKMTGRGGNENEKE